MNRNNRKSARPLRGRFASLAAVAIVSAASLLVSGATRFADDDAIGMRHAEAPPNIIVILADDLGYGDLGAYGQKKIQTPRLDRMAAEGIRFTDFYAGNTVCAPSRVALLSGVDMAHAHTRSNRGPGLLEEDVVIAEVLKQADYATGIFGKWGFGEPGSGSPDRQGFDEFLGYLGHVHAHSYYTDHLFGTRNGRTERIEIDSTQYTHDLFMDAALDFIDRNRERPFFLYLPVALVHAELLLPEEDMTPYQDEDGNSRMLPETPFPCCGVIGTYRGQPQPHAAFAGMVSRLDRDVGRILDHLRALGLDERTLVVFTSDNGPHVEGGADPGFFESNGPLRGMKRDLYEGGVRVPMIAWGPGFVPAGGVRSHPWSVVDFLATFADLAGVPSPETNGLSMVNLLTGEGPVPMHRYFYWEFDNNWGGHYVQAIRQEDWKLLRFRTPDTTWTELYDLRTDIGEYNDLSLRFPDVVADMERFMDAIRTEP